MPHAVRRGILCLWTALLKQGHLHRKGSVSLVRYHLIWIPRRRRKVLVSHVADRLDTLLHEKAAELDLGVLRLAIQPDHLHLFVTAPPDIAPAQIAFRLKGYTSRVLRQEFPHLRRMPSMWTTSYFVSTAGNVSAQTIERYIQAQSTRA
jgi:putative transposase